ncbi:hypothetical protein Q764_10300 [Flavobacterium suncheonense GH29-5 = DSM 17707]|uniref:Uncharacterized protein n=1 Tax=Flavobacterium suncheonense GH29-5 = DSM 17707 TaxID=1121899 RepID=A0A0A2MBF8_9FLAO|nr:hypothetical protein Q764_10300 [Flavobacterium suncheonense GH29-5 = DSM 17707]
MKKKRLTTAITILLREIFGFVGAAYLSFYDKLRMTTNYVMKRNSTYKGNAKTTALNTKYLKTVKTIMFWWSDDTMFLLKN